MKPVPATILIVEDHIGLANGMQLIISKYKPLCKVVITPRKSDALAFAKHNHVDIFCLDINLEDGSGFDLALELRSLMAYKMTPIIFITADPTLEHHALKEIHCYDYLVKPFPPKEFQSLIADLLEFGIFRDRARHHGPGPGQTPTKATLRVNCKFYTYSLDQEQIVYLESNLRQVRIVTTKEDFETSHHSLSNFSKVLLPNFAKCHKSFYVNTHYISHIDFAKQEIMLKETYGVLPLGRSYIKEFKNALAPENF